ncbi:MAG: hypothetical protein CFE23_14270 [Flavobacterium sp. BFFFF1]|uniref:DUF4249 domain-containing protein n=1 Tax=unclassified Flavobacterium TaxID=196869 RepID=UPI000BD1DB52|nr:MULTISPECIES: DUF4249 domain-containing protein [unclassified Flavobacterium]OYU79399.1 MAG: hypothetical protein CFE23_14270 [Flavobacterium sp. BFFFF1]
MKKILPIILGLIALSFSSCEEVVDVNLDTAAPRLVIDASIQWKKGTAGNEQTIYLTTTTGYFDSIVPKVSNATVFVINTDNGARFDFIETPGTGEYTCSQFIPILNANYELTVMANGQTYFAREKMIPAPEIQRIEQKTNDGFNGEYYEIKAFYQDDPALVNYYLYRYKANFDVFPTYEAADDEFDQGNETFALYINEDIKAGDNLDMSIYGISQRYYDYMNKLISIAGNSGNGSPFQSPPATVRGNIVNTTDENNYSLGYFNISEVTTQNYVVQ